MQVAGFLAPLWLIAEMGQMAIIFTLALVALTIGWYFHYARDRIKRTGAIFHTFARLGQLKHRGLDRELRDIVKEKGLREEDPYDEVVARASVILLDRSVTFDEMEDQIRARLQRVAGLPPERIERGMMRAKGGSHGPDGGGNGSPALEGTRRVTPDDGAGAASGGAPRPPGDARRRHRLPRSVDVLGGCG